MNKSASLNSIIRISGSSKETYNAVSKSSYMIIFVGVNSVISHDIFTFSGSYCSDGSTITVKTGFYNSSLRPSLEVLDEGSYVNFLMSISAGICLRGSEKVISTIPV